MSNGGAPFPHLHPFFYWSCPSGAAWSRELPCNATAPADPKTGTPLQWTCNFDYGFASTSSLIQLYFVMVYYPIEN